MEKVIITKDIKRLHKRMSNLTTICRECGRYKKIPIYHCNACWQEMENDLVKKE